MMIIVITIAVATKIIISETVKMGKSMHMGAALFVSCRYYPTICACGEVVGGGGGGSKKHGRAGLEAWGPGGGGCVHTLDPATWLASVPGSL